MPEKLVIALNSFRAFADTGPITIKPLTLLVGENSTGKTSFLSALNFALNLSNREKVGYFNTQPFDLGSYEDIVHDSGIRSTDHRFAICIEKSVNIATDGSIVMGDRPKADVAECKLKIIFKSSYGDVALSNFQFSFEDTEVSYESRPLSHFIIKSRGVVIGEFGPRQHKIFSDMMESRNADLRRISYALFDGYYGSEPSRRAEKSDESRQLGRAVHAFDAFISSAYELYSSPPVRSVPRRVYTSSDEAASQESAHAPHELNRLKRSDRRRWGRLNSGLNNFGRLSGLFTKFDIAKLTKQDAGPFQVKVTVRGRSSNIADVGYGVSQALPIMTDLIESQSQKSAFLFQQPEVHLHPRAQASLGTIFTDFISKNTHSFIVAETHSDYMIDRIRIHVRRGHIDPNLVNILYFCPIERDVQIYEIGLDKQGNLIGAPPQYRDFFIREEEDVLGF